MSVQMRGMMLEEGADYAPKEWSFGLGEYPKIRDENDKTRKSIPVF